jgi:hypothetical protein
MSDIDRNTDLEFAIILEMTLMLQRTQILNKLLAGFQVPNRKKAVWVTMKVL